MSNEKQNIDEFLKQNLEHFAPDAPNVWQHIQTHVQVAGQATSAAAVKTGLSVFVKAIITTVSVATVALIAYVAINSTEPSIQVAAEQQSLMPVLQSPKAETPTLPDPETAIAEAKIKATNPSKKPGAAVNTEHTNQTAPQQLEIMNDANLTNKEKVSTPIQAPPFSSSIGIPSTTESQTQVVVGSEPKEAPKPNNQEMKMQSESDASVNESNSLRVEPSTPGSFSPNGDGINDTYIIDIENEVLYRLTIRNKAEKVVFESTDKNEHWDGIDRNTGKPCEEGYYLAELVYQLKGDMKPSSKAKIFAIKRKN